MNHDPLEQQLRRDARGFSPEVSPDLNRRIHRAVVESAQRDRLARPQRTAWWRLAFGGALAGALAAVAFLAWPTTPTDRPTIANLPPAPATPRFDDLPALVQSPLEQELSALADDAKQLGAPLMFLVASPVPRDNTTQPKP